MVLVLVLPRSAGPLVQRDHVSPLAQLVQVVRPLLHLVKALCQVLGAVVAAAVGVLHRVCQVGFDGKRVKIELIHQHRAGACPESVPRLFRAETQGIKGGAH